MKRSYILWVLAAGWTLVIPLLSLLPPAFFSGASQLNRIPGLDKVIHAGIYGLQTILLIAVWCDWKKASGLRLVFLPALLATAYGLLMEVLQRLLTECRQFSWGDALANAVGALIAALLMVCLMACRRSAAKPA